MTSTFLNSIFSILTCLKKLHMRAAMSRSMCTSPARRRYCDLYLPSFGFSTSSPSITIMPWKMFVSSLLMVTSVPMNSLSHVSIPNLIDLPRKVASAHSAIGRPIVTKSTNDSTHRITISQACLSSCGTSHEASSAIRCASASPAASSEENCTSEAALALPRGGCRPEAPACSGLAPAPGPSSFSMKSSSFACSFLACRRLICSTRSAFLALAASPSSAATAWRTTTSLCSSAVTSSAASEAQDAIVCGTCASAPGNSTAAARTAFMTIDAPGGLIGQLRGNQKRNAVCGGASMDRNSTWNGP
mmetsp:Transcript_29243/g.78081  ORF Transcript_29243/g.78081 Transcript_29243/m.78081 type:complete len:303 (-) Transcript_29243:12-920(-)